MNKAADNFRFVFLMAATLGIMSLGAVQLMKIQLVDGSSYLEKSRSSGIATQVIRRRISGEQQIRLQRRYRKGVFPL